MSARRKESLVSLRSSGLPVVLITEETFPSWNVQRDLVPPQFANLSAVHKADYARTYLMHVHGGGYTDLKPTSASWWGAVGDWLHQEVWINGYPEAKPEDVAVLPHDPAMSNELRVSWQKLVGNGAYLVKKQIPFTRAWLDGANSVLEKHKDALMRCTSTPPRAARGEPSPVPYPVGWTELLGQVFHPLLLTCHQRIRHTLPAPRMTDYV